MSFQEFCSAASGPDVGDAVVVGPEVVAALDWVVAGPEVVVAADVLAAELCVELSTSPP
jgi:hypothetical protein